MSCLKEFCRKITKLKKKKKNNKMETALQEILSDLLIKENCSIRALSKKIKIESSQLVRYLNGTLPNFSTAIIIANYIKCSLNYLYGIDEKYIRTKQDIILDKYNFINKYLKLLKDNNTSHFKLSKKIAICETSLRIWKKHTIPSTNAVIEIANYFNVSIDYLVTKVE